MKNICNGDLSIALTNNIHIVWPSKKKFILSTLIQKLSTNFHFTLKSDKQHKQHENAWIPCGFAFRFVNAKWQNSVAHNVGTKLVERSSNELSGTMLKFVRMKWNAWAQAKSGVIIQHSCRCSLFGHCVRLLVFVFAALRWVCKKVV